MRKLFVVAGLTTLVVFFSCEKEIIPSADFTVEFGNEYPPHMLVNMPEYATYEPIRFVPVGKNVQKYQWNFGGDQIFTDKSPIIHFVEGGDYTVTLTVESETGNRETSVKTIHIFERMVKDIIIDVKSSQGNVHSTDWTQPQNVMIEIGIMKEDDIMYPSMILYSSGIIPNVSSASSPVTIHPEDEVKVDFALLNDQVYPQLVLQLYTLKGDEQKLIHSSNILPGLTSFMDHETGLFKLQSGGLIKLNCEFH
jgi:hypothetical protein